MIEDAYTETEINESISSFSDLMDNICFPLFGKTSNPKPQNSSNINDFIFNNICSEKRKHFYSKLNDFRKNKTEINRHNMMRARTEYKNAVRKYNFEKDMQKIIKLLTAKYKNAKQYWKLLKESVTEPKCSNLSATDFANYFKSINNSYNPFFQSDDDILYFNERFLNSEIQVMFEELNGSVTQEEIMRAIRQLKNGRSGGPDKFLNEFCVYGTGSLSPFSSVLFNNIFDTGYFPESWSEEYIVPLHKKGKLDDVSNFREITLLSALGKIFTRILNNRLTDWAEEYYVYIEAQAGFRSNMSTVDSIFLFMASLIIYLIKEKTFLCLRRFFEGF